MRNRIYAGAGRTGDRRLRLFSAAVAVLLLCTACAGSGSSSISSDHWRYREAESKLMCFERKCTWIRNGVSYCACGV